ncbi:hypothetical protein AtubIFM54640_009977 [Aspergillus tubingensis]|nr:carbamoyl-phosphate synthase arginine-specific large chain [Aspergillus tubingensis]GFN19956.1 carbamoyl-phosphate synthase arginine-specific large chain [Aspergillus tubingensis]GLA67003.1 hypothetical protein AtubIFM54640_009977 [Aspergillus tubingensis]GLA96976.1 hypothetical protein AtubIFM57143_004459 [Aspergillus tubingensis]
MERKRHEKYIPRYSLNFEASGLSIIRTSFERPVPENISLTWTVHDILGYTSPLPASVHPSWYLLYQQIVIYTTSTCKAQEQTDAMSGISQSDYTRKTALFKLPDKGDYSLGAEPPSASNRLTYNTDDASTLERFRIRELCEGWPLHRDACEWSDLREIFDPKAFINISWQQNYRDKAIDTWAEGWAKSEFICHRVLGHAVDIKGDRAIDKMKCTISCRFADENGVEWDSDCDC